MSMGSQLPSLHITGLGASKFKNLNTLLSHLTIQRVTSPALTKRCINIKAIGTLYTDTDQAPLRVPIIPLPQLARNPTEYKLEWLSSSGDIWQASLSPKSSISFLPRHSDFTFYLQQVNKAPQNLVQIKARKKNTDIQLGKKAKQFLTVLLPIPPLVAFSLVAFLEGYRALDQSVKKGCM